MEATQPAFAPSAKQSAIHDRSIQHEVEIDDAVLPPGIHGLPGLHERAGLVGGKLAIWSETDSGTEIELSIPGSVAFAKSSDVRRSVASNE